MTMVLQKLSNQSGEMMNKKITMISGSMSTSEALKNQLIEYHEIFSDIELYAIDDYLPSIITCDLIIYSSQISYDEIQILDVSIRSKEKIIAYRTIDFSRLDKLVRLKKNEQVLVVNDTMETTVNIIDHLQAIGLEDVNFVPYYPGIDFNRAIKTAVTPGELHLIPEGIEKVVDIGPRLFDYSTVFGILEVVGVNKDIGSTYSQKYLSKIINITKNNSRFLDETEELNEQLNLILSSIDEGILVFDNQNQIKIVNHQFLKFFNMPYRNLVGQDIREIITDYDLIDFCIGIKNEHESIFHINHINLAFSRSRLSSGLIIVIVKNIEERMLETRRLNRELIKKGHYAKYTFDHIIGDSKAIREAKYVANKLARSELTILIQGESGTGKELFASAIHNESLRKNQAFLAINCSAFTDTLIESELFGYEDGAFTGAKKGGKSGLFELADSGTLFLDEIGDISPKMQTKLLRVLQEGEIIRVGGSHVKSVDVRIIAATNKNLAEMVDSSNFREDLYYRLKIGIVNLPTLRDRRSDIVPLIEHFLEGNYQMDEESEALMRQKDWKGNIRELKSTIMYMKALAKDHILTKNELPKDVYDRHKRTIALGEVEKVLLSAIYETNQSGVSCGRQTIHRLTYERLRMTENQIRGRVQKLILAGYLNNSKGPLGTFVTELGVSALEDSE